MPHFVIEHAESLTTEAEVQTAMRVALDCGAASGFIKREDIKVRALPYSDVLCGDGRTSFIHLTVSLLEGRTDDQKETLAIALREALGQEFSDVQSISIDIGDMNPASYKKRLVD